MVIRTNDDDSIIDLGIIGILSSPEIARVPTETGEPVKERKPWSLLHIMIR